MPIGEAAPGRVCACTAACAAGLFLKVGRIIGLDWDEEKVPVMHVYFFYMQKLGEARKKVIGLFKDTTPYWVVRRGKRLTFCWRQA